MKADTWQFRLANLAIGCALAGPLWYLFHPFVHHLFFLLPLYWIMHLRDSTSRFREINARLRLQHNLLGALLDEDEDYVSSYQSLLDFHGFRTEADALDEDRS
jgi:hypothetical protein